MKFETRTDENGEIILKLGLTHEVHFPAQMNLEHIVVGVANLVQAVSGISHFDMVQAVVNEYGKNGQFPEGVERPTVQ